MVFGFLLTGEGEINSQSSQGKAIGKIATLEKKYPIPMIALSGRIDGNIEKLYSMEISSTTSIALDLVSLEEAITNAEKYLETKLIDLCQLMKHC